MPNAISGEMVTLNAAPARSQVSSHGKGRRIKCSDNGYGLSGPGTAINLGTTYGRIGRTTDRLGVDMVRFV